MVTVQHLVKKELERNPFLVDMLEEGLLNVSAVATKISHEISREMGKEIKLSAISMGIRRFTQAISTKNSQQWKFPKNVEISTKSQIYEVAIEKTPAIPIILKRLYKRIRREKGEFLSVVEGTYEFVIFTNQSKKEDVREALKGKKITSELNNAAYVTVNWKRITKDIPGIYYRITRALAFKGISIQSFHTIGAEMILFFKEDVFIEAYRTIAALLRNEIS